MNPSKLLRALAIGGAALAVGLLGVNSASAAPPVKPTPSCKVPIFSVNPTTAVPGTKIKVSGVNFSGCSAQGNPAKPTAVLTVKVGVITAAKVTEVLATTTTSSTGSFSVQVTIPKISAGGQPKIILAAAAVDPVTKLSYEGVASIAYSTPTTTTPTPTPTATSTATPPSTASTTSAPTTSSTEQPTSSSVDVPTAVPAGSGGFGAPSGPGEIGTEVGLGAAGVALVALGGLGLARRRVRQH